MLSSAITNPNLQATVRITNSKLIRKSQRPSERRNLKEQDWEGTSLVVQWLRLHAPNVGGPGSIPGQATIWTPEPQDKAKQTYWSVPHSWLPTPAPLCGSRHIWTSCRPTAGAGSASQPPALMSPQPHLLALLSTGGLGLGILRPSDSWAAAWTILATALPSTEGLMEGALQNTRGRGLNHRLRWATGLTLRITEPGYQRNVNPS